MFLIVGLGNPGPKYTFTKHNIGFLSVDYLAQAFQMGTWKESHKSLMIKSEIKGSPVILAKPQTYMNKSGESVVSLSQFYKIPLENLLVIQDDIDQVFGKIRFHKNRGHGGHNGIRNISELLGSADYCRLKLGVGRPSHPEHDIADWVLSPFAKEEQNVLSEFLNKSVDAVEAFIVDGFQKASTKFNG